MVCVNAVSRFRPFKEKGSVMKIHGLWSALLCVALAAGVVCVTYSAYGACPDETYANSLCAGTYVMCVRNSGGGCPTFAHDIQVGPFTCGAPLEGNYCIDGTTMMHCTKYAKCNNSAYGCSLDYSVSWSWTWHVRKIAPAC